MGVTWSEEQADSASFLAVIPPPAVVGDVRALQEAAGIDTATLPHITVKAQPGLERVDRWRPVVREACAAIEPVSVGLPGVGRFGDGIVFLSVAGSGIVGLHRRVLDAVEWATGGGRDTRFEYDGDDFVPHLTLAADFAGASRAQLDAIAGAAGDRQWPDFVVHEVIELRRTGRDQPYLPIDRFPLAGG